MIPKEFIDQLLERTNLVAFLRQYVPDLKHEGASYTACCPFHEEKSASFKISPGKDFYHCFGCNAHGNAINFLMEKQGLSFVNAVQEVARFNGIQVPEKADTVRMQIDKDRALRYKQVSGAMVLAQSIFSSEFKKSESAQQYLNGRGISQQSIAKFGIGYAPDGWQTICANKSFKRDVYIDAGLSIRHEEGNHVYDRFRNRIMFPILDSKDKVVGFGGRALGNAPPKYLNSPETMLFRKGSHLYGLSQARESIQHARRVYVVEGYMDVVMTSQFGVENVVAAMGTAITENQIQRLFSLADHVTLCFDGDRPGQAAAFRAAEIILPLINDALIVDFMFLPDDLDPDELIRERGKEAFEQLGSQAMPLIDFMLDRLAGNRNMNISTNHSRFLSVSLVHGRRIANEVLTMSFAKRAAEMAGIPFDRYLAMLNSKEPVAMSHVSAAAKILGVCAIKSKDITLKLDRDFLSRFLSDEDQQMLFPLLEYISSHDVVNENELTNIASGNEHAGLLNSLYTAARNEPDFDALMEARAIIHGFKKLEKLAIA